MKNVSILLLLTPGIIATECSKVVAVGVQVSERTEQNLEERVGEIMTPVTKVSMLKMMRTSAEQEATAKFKHLIKDYSKMYSATE